MIFGFSPEGQILLASIHPADGFCLASIALVCLFNLIQIFKI